MEFHGLNSMVEFPLNSIPWIKFLVGYSPWGHTESDTTVWLSTHTNVICSEKFTNSLTLSHYHLLIFLRVKNAESDLVSILSFHENDDLKESWGLKKTDMDSIWTFQIQQMLSCSYRDYGRCMRTMIKKKKKRQTLSYDQNPSPTTVFYI